MNHPRLIRRFPRRFPRRQSDAHLLTPPDTTAFTYILDCSERMIHGWQPLIDEFAANGIKAPASQLYSPPFPLSKLVDAAVQLGVFDRIDTWEEEGGYYRYVRITRRPKLSPKLLAHLTPLQRQRLRSPTSTINNRHSSIE